MVISRHSQTAWSCTKYAVLAVISSVFLFASSVSANVWYVNNIDGRDTNTGLSKTPSKLGTGPFRTVGRALKAAGSGDTIVLENTGRPYYESISVSGGSHSGFAGHPFHIKGNGAVLSGLAPVDSSLWTAVKTGVYKLRSKNGNHGQLYHKGRPMPFQKLTLKTIDQLKPLHFTLIDGEFYFRTEDDRLPNNLPIDQTYHTTGITLYGVDNVVIEDLIVQGFALDGVNAFDNVSDSRLRGVNSRGNGRSGVSVGGGAELKIESSTVGDNLLSQLRTEVLGTMKVKDSAILEYDFGTKIDQKGGKIEIE